MLNALILRWAFNAVALFVAAWLLDGVTYGDSWWTLLVAAAVFTVVNAWVKPILALLSIPFIVVTARALLLPDQRADALHDRLGRAGLRARDVLVGGACGDHRLARQLGACNWRCALPPSD